MQVTVTITDACGSIDPWISEIARGLRYEKTIFKSPEQMREDIEKEIARTGSAAKVKKVIKEVHDLFSLDKQKNVAYFLPGLLDRVLGLLTKKNISVSVIDKRSYALMPKPVWANVQPTRGRQLEILGRISVSHGGIIKGATGTGKSFILKQLCLMYPTLNILIATKKSAVVRSIVEDISAALPGQVGQFGAGKSTGVGKRVVITTTKSMDKVDPQDVHLLLLDECQWHS